jgi:hypothetical protein
MRATAWNNGSHHASGAGYGLRISEKDRDSLFDRSWREVVFDLGGEAEATARLSESFWRSCSELRSAEIGRWLRRHNLAPWPHGRPPTFTVRHLEGNRFSIALPPQSST